MTEAFEEVWGPINSPNDVFQKAWALLKSMDPDRPPKFRSMHNPWNEDWGDIVSFDPEQIKHDNQLERHPAVQILTDISQYYTALDAMGRIAAGQGQDTPLHLDERIRTFTGDTTSSFTTNPAQESFTQIFDAALRYVEHNQSDLDKRYYDNFNVRQRSGLSLLGGGFKQWDPHYFDVGAVHREVFGEEIAQQAGAKPAPFLGSTMGKDLVSDFLWYHGYQAGPRGKHVWVEETDAEGKKFDVMSTDYSGGGEWQPDEMLYLPPPKEYDHGAHIDVVNGHRSILGIEGEIDGGNNEEYEMDPGLDGPGRAFRNPGSGGTPRFNKNMRPTLDDVATGIRQKLESGARYSQDNWWEEAYPDNPELWWPNLTLDNLRSMYHNHHEGTYDEYVGWDENYENVDRESEDDNMGEYLRRWPWLHPDTNLDTFDADDYTTYADYEEDPLTMDKEHFKDLYENELHPGVNLINAKLHQAFLDRMDVHARTNLARQGMGDMI